MTMLLLLLLLNILTALPPYTIAQVCLHTCNSKHTLKKKKKKSLQENIATTQSHISDIGHDLESAIGIQANSRSGLQTRIFPVRRPNFYFYLFIFSVMEIE